MVPENPHPLSFAAFLAIAAGVVFSTLSHGGRPSLLDPGVTHTLAGTENLDRNSDLYGNSFEQFICMELRAYLSYMRKKLPLTYWRSKNGHEVDFLLGTTTAIEVKASKKISPNDLKGLKYVKEDGVFQNFILVSRDPLSTLTDNLLTMTWNKFQDDLWKDKFV